MCSATQVHSSVEKILKMKRKWELDPLFIEQSSLCVSTLFYGTSKDIVCHCSQLQWWVRLWGDYSMTKKGLSKEGTLTPFGLLFSYGYVFPKRIKTSRVGSASHTTTITQLTNDQQVDSDWGGAESVGALASVDPRVFGLDSADLQGLFVGLETGPGEINNATFSVLGPIDHGVGVTRHWTRQACVRAC